MMSRRIRAIQGFWNELDIEMRYRQGRSRCRQSLIARFSVRHRLVMSGGGVTLVVPSTGLTIAR
jgi:hypothetical protein